MFHNEKEKNNVYLLVKKDNIKFKIGVSKNLNQRIQQVCAISNIDFENSYEILVKSNREAYNLEKALHYTFSHKNVTGDIPNGKTEWFEMDCLPEVLEFINEINKIKKNIILKKGIHPIPIKNKRSINNEEIMKKSLRLAKAKIMCMGKFLEENKSFILGHGYYKNKIEFFCIKIIDKEYVESIMNFFHISYFHGGHNLISHAEGNEKFVHIYFERKHYTLNQELIPHVNLLYNLIDKIKAQLTVYESHYQ